MKNLSKAIATGLMTEPTLVDNLASIIDVCGTQLQLLLAGDIHLPEKEEVESRISDDFANRWKDSTLTKIASYNISEFDIVDCRIRYYYNALAIGKDGLLEDKFGFIYITLEIHGN